MPLNPAAGLISKKPSLFYYFPHDVSARSRQTGLEDRWVCEEDFPNEAEPFFVEQNEQPPEESEIVDFVATNRLNEARTEPLGTMWSKVRHYKSSGESIIRDEYKVPPSGVGGYVYRVEIEVDPSGETRASAWRKGSTDLSYTPIRPPAVQANSIQFSDHARVFFLNRDSLDVKNVPGFMVEGRDAIRIDSWGGAESTYILKSDNFDGAVRFKTSGTSVTAAWRGADSPQNPGSKRVAYQVWAGQDPTKGGVIFFCQFADHMEIREIDFGTLEVESIRRLMRG